MSYFPEIIFNQNLCFYKIKVLHRFLSNTGLVVYLMIGCDFLLQQIILFRGLIIALCKRVRKHKKS